MAKNSISFLKILAQTKSYPGISTKSNLPIPIIEAATKDRMKVP